jgi:hypothetical protein
VTAKFVLISLVCVSTMLNNVPVVLADAHMGNVGLNVFAHSYDYRDHFVLLEGSAPHTYKSPHTEYETCRQDINDLFQQYSF